MRRFCLFKDRPFRFEESCSELQGFIVILLYLIAPQSLADFSSSGISPNLLRPVHTWHKPHMMVYYSPNRAPLNMYQDFPRPRQEVPLIPRLHLLIQAPTFIHRARLPKLLLARRLLYRPFTPLALEMLHHHQTLEKLQQIGETLFFMDGRLFYYHVRRFCIFPFIISTSYASRAQPFSGADTNIRAFY